jgi:hypothetical protein
MGCCGKAAKKIGNIAVGWANLARGIKYEFTDDRIRACQKCEKAYWKGRNLWCKKCLCFVPAKARVESEKCPLGKWRR